ncbi:MAG: HlyD family efflux transporter periplasmic adaptor subunit [Sphingobacteriales bacterium]|nr:MAG: HlyD family efflux transporter periplasmic adaptor subunit [Sphingobacteriales bacterium]
MSETDIQNTNNRQLLPEETSKYHLVDRSEEVRDIIDRMPSKFGAWIGAVVLFIFVFILIFGYVIRYPDTVQGQITISTSIAPLRLIASSAGRLKLTGKLSHSNVKTGDVIAYIDNPTSYDTLQIIRKILKTYNPNDPRSTSILSVLPSKAALGELTSKYYIFLSSIHQIANFDKDRLYDKQISSFKDLYQHQIGEIETSTERLRLNNITSEYSKKIVARDSTLFLKKVGTEAELERSKMNYLNHRAGIANARSNLIDAKKQAQQTLNRISEVEIEKTEKRTELEIALLASYNDLINNIALWEQKYLFVAPFNGQLEFLKFWKNNQFIQEREPVFTIVPALGQPYGQVTLPAIGVGKVKPGQEVIVKLDDFPYQEYGSITGRIETISLATNTEKTEQGSVETYLVGVKFPKGLTTNYGRKLNFRQESKGLVEIIAKDRRLIERLFDNLTYAIKK